MLDFARPLRVGWRGLTRGADGRHVLLDSRLDEGATPMSEQVKETVTQTRRSFLRGAAVVAGAAAAATAPTVAKAQGPMTMRGQSTWPQKDIFHEDALAFAKTGNDITGGVLKMHRRAPAPVVPTY